nr:MAG TPA: hypothetical protein [Bacteriophage sp.]
MRYYDTCKVFPHMLSPFQKFHVEHFLLFLFLFETEKRLYPHYSVKFAAFPKNHKNF